MLAVVREREGEESDVVLFRNYYTAPVLCGATTVLEIYSVHVAQIS